MLWMNSDSQHMQYKTHGRAIESVNLGNIVSSCLEALVENNLLSSWGWEVEVSGGGV